MKRTQPLRRGGPLRRRKRPNPRSKGWAAERLRIYGPPERRAWIAAMHCCACFAPGPCENAHVSSGGMGRKADANRIVPLCHACHEEQHRIGWPAFAEKHGTDWAAFGWLAGLYDGAWLRAAASNPQAEQ